MLRRSVLERAPHLGARGVGLKLSHLVNQVGSAALGAHAEGSGEHTLRPLVPPVVEVMVEADQLGRRVMDAVRDAVDDTVRDSELSLPVATACGACLRHHERLPTVAEEDALVRSLIAKIVESREREDVLGPEAFASAAGPRFRQTWMAGGTQRLAKWPPSDIGLGHDERPPLVTPPVDQSRTWLQGTDRSVHSRYALFYDGRASLRPSANRQHDCTQDGQRRRGGDVVGLSVDLACQTYGLEHEEHHTLLRLLSAHADGPAPSGTFRPPLRRVDWDQECRPIPLPGVPAHDRLLDRVLDLQESWWHSPAGRLIRDRCGEPSSYLHLLRELLVRRVWQSLTGRERELVLPAGTCAVDGLVRTALTKGVGTVLPAMLRDGQDLPPPPSHQRLQATLELVSTEQMQTDGSDRVPSAEEISSRYEALLAERGAAAEHQFLDRHEFAVLMSSAGLWESETLVEEWESDQ